MKNILKLIAVVTLVFCALFGVVTAATILFPGLGGTGTSQIPTYGQVLVGNSGGTYTPTATSSLGISGSGSSGVSSFNTRTGAVTLTSGDVTGALTFTPYNSTNPSGYISGITSGNVTTALGFTPYDSANPSNYLANITGLITAGTNVGLSGAGTVGSPYAISSSGGGGTSGPATSTNPLMFTYAVATTTGAQLTENGINLIIASTTNTNYFFGGAGNVTASGRSNTAQGGFSLANLQTGVDNTGLGYFAVENDLIGSNNTGIGFGAGLNNGGDTNTSLGWNALANNFTGSNNVALGALAGQYETGSNTLYIDNQNRSTLAGGRTGSLVYGVFNATPSSQLLTLNASTTISQNLTVLGTGTSTFSNGINLVGGCVTYNSGACIGGSGSGITALTGDVTASGPGSAASTLATVNSNVGAFTNANITVNGKGLITAAANGTGGTASKQLVSWIVAAAGGDYTTLQAAMDRCGVVGGGNIYLTDPSYSGNFLWKGSNCYIWGRGSGTTTINITGATTAFKTNSAAGQYTHDELHNIFISGDGNVGGVAINWSDMTHGVVDNVQTSNVGTSILLNDTQNITFYNSFTNLDFNDNHAFCINASSTNPVNANTFQNIFCGDAATSNVIGVQMNNANGNTLENIRVEPGTLTGTVGLKLFDNRLASNNGVFNNRFTNWYIEANGTGVSIPLTTNAASGGIQRNYLEEMTVEANTTDWSVSPGAVALNNFLCGYDSNFGNCITSFQGPFGIGTSTEMQSIGTTPFAAFALSASTTQATNEAAFAMNTTGGNYRTDFLLNASGNGFFYQPLTLKSTENSGGTGDLVLDTSAANFSAGGPTIAFKHGGTTVITEQASLGAGLAAPFLSFFAPSGSFATGFGSSTPYANLSVQSNTAMGDIFVLATTTGNMVAGEDNAGHRFTGGPKPAVSSCGTGSPTVVGDDQGGTITTGSAASSCTLTFAAKYANTPYCTESDSSTASTGDISSISTTAVTFSFSVGLTGGTIYYQCGYHK